jgi:hypothetical protein
MKHLETTFVNGILHTEATTARIDAAIAVAPLHLHPVLVAVRDYRVAMLFVPPGTETFTIPAKPTRAAVVMVGDDMEQSVGPEGFHLPSVRRVIRACSAFTVISSEPTATLYALGTAPAVGGQNVMIIETRIEHEFQWVALIQKLRPGRPLIISTVKGGHA